jgi:hypothetical protein
VIRFENLTSLDLSNSTHDLFGQRRNSLSRHQQVMQAVESINYAIQNLKKV